MSRHLIACPHCGTVGATTDYDLEWFYEDDLEEIQTEFDEDSYNEAPEANPQRQLHEPYQRVDEYIERLDDRSVRETHLAGQRTQGLVVETIRNEVPAPPKPKVQTRTAMIQQLPTFTPSRAPKRRQLTDADAARPGFESLGDDPSQDYYSGLSGKELHQEQLLQAAYEADIRDRGFNPENSPFV